MRTERLVMRSRLLVVTLALVCACAIVCTPAPAADTGSLYDTLAATKDATIFFVAVKEAEEVALLKGQDGFALFAPGDGCSDNDACRVRAKPVEYTLFAPSDAAFKKLDDDTIRKIATDTATVKRLIRAHLVVGKFTTDELKKMPNKNVATLAGTAS